MMMKIYIPDLSGEGIEAVLVTSADIPYGHENSHWNR
jgi:hypothetical protein